MTIAPIAPVVMIRKDAPVMPEPQPEPTEGVRAKAGDTFLVGVHDNLNPIWIAEIGYPGARTIVNKSNLRQTNEMLVPNEWRQKDDGTWGVNRNGGQIKYWPESLGSEWLDYFYSQMTDKQHELFEGHNFGWRDGTKGQLNVFKMVVCGGQLFKSIGRWNEYSLVAVQDTNGPPEYSTYHAAPTRWIKQGICGHSTEKDQYGHYISHYGKVNPQIGDLYIPCACAGGIAGILTSETREHWSLPHDTQIDGVPVTVVEMCYRASEVLGRIEGGGWYYILEQRTKNGNSGDFVVHAPDWPDVLPVPVVGWKKDYTFLERLFKTLAGLFV